MMELMERFGNGSGEDDGLKVRGFIRAVAIDRRTGEVLAERETRNQVTNGGLQLIAKQITLDMTPVTGDAIDFADVGTSATGFASTDVYSKSQLASRVTNGGAAAANERIAVSGTTSAIASSGITCQYTWSYDTNQAINGGTAVLNEVGLFNRSVTTAGTMMARATFGDISKNSDVQVSFTYQLRFTA